MPCDQAKLVVSLGMRCLNMIYIGTAGYSYADWVGPYYPPGTKTNEMLNYYAAEFPFTEVNATYYRIPHYRMLQNMDRKTPEGFLFVIKAHQSLTHRREEDCGKIARQFREALLPLQEKGSLAGVLAQFPYSFRNNEANRNYLAGLREFMKGIPLLVEFRHQSWCSPAVFEFLRAYGMSYVCVDEPPLKGLLPPVVAVTADPAYLRFHGRNTDKWWNHRYPYERYNYLYAESELQEWVSRIARLAEASSKVFISLNNHFQGKAVINARMLGTMLEKAGLTVWTKSTP